MLPNAYHWREHEGGALLHFNYGWVATVEADGTTRLQGWGVKHQAKAASQAQGRRFVERWVAARVGVPGFGRRRGVSATPCTKTAPPETTNPASAG